MTAPRRMPRGARLQPVGSGRAGVTQAGGRLRSRQHGTICRPAIAWQHPPRAHTHIVYTLSAAPCYGVLDHLLRGLTHAPSAHTGVRSKLLRDAYAMPRRCADAALTPFTELRRRLCGQVMYTAAPFLTGNCRGDHRCHAIQLRDRRVPWYTIGYHWQIWKLARAPYPRVEIAAPSTWHQAHRNLLNYGTQGSLLCPGHGHCGAGFAHVRAWKTCQGGAHNLSDGVIAVMLELFTQRGFQSIFR